MEILFHDEKIAVCVKPAGLDSQEGMTAALSAQLGGTFYPLHRLDLNVGGLMVFARTKESAAQFSRLIQDGALVKEYVALVHGTPAEYGDWEDLLFKDSRKNKVFVVKRQRTGVKAARLEYRRLTDTDPALVRIRLHTGRTHQIRVQFSSRGFPLLGDYKYGSHGAQTAPMLFSCYLQFPYKGQTRTFEILPDWCEKK